MSGPQQAAAPLPRSAAAPLPPPPPSHLARKASRALPSTLGHLRVACKAQIESGAVRRVSSCVHLLISPSSQSLTQSTAVVKTPWALCKQACAGNRHGEPRLLSGRGPSARPGLHGSAGE